MNTSKFLVSVVIAATAMFSTCNVLVAQPASRTETPEEFKNTNSPQAKMLDRLLCYLTIDSQSIDDPDPNSFPLTDGQRKIAHHIYDEVKSFGGKDVKVTLSDSYYVYVEIPSNIKRDVPSVLFMTHLDVTPEAPGKGIKPMVHYNFDGGDILLPAGITLSPNTPQGAHLKELIGKTIVTSDGSTLLGTDDKAGVAVLVSLIENLVKNPKIKHGPVMLCFSQNEDVGKAQQAYQPEIFGVRPDIVIDVDGDSYDRFSVANFTAECYSYHFHGNKAHPSHGLENRYADALSASCSFVGLIPPTLHPSSSSGTEGYLHCYYMNHPVDSTGHPIESDYEIRVRLRYFNETDGEYQRKLLEDNLRKTQEAFPFVKSFRTSAVLQYGNVSNSMPKYVPGLVQKGAHDAGMEIKPEYARGGSTSGMLVTKFPDSLPGGTCIYSGQNAEHSVFEFCCVEELIQLVDVVKNIVAECTKIIDVKGASQTQGKLQPTNKKPRRLPHGVD